MSDKKRIDQLEKEVEELKNANEYYERECNSFWAKLSKRQEFHLEIAQKIVKTDNKAIANIIRNMYFGKMQSDGCSFCEIFDLKGKGCCKKNLRCTDCIDNFLQKHYTEETQAVCGRKGRMSEVSIFTPDGGWFQSDCNVKPIDKQLCVVIHGYGNPSPGIYQFRKADWLHSKSDYFLDVAEKWELDNVECSEEWSPSFATFDIIRCWKPLGLPENDNKRLLMEIEKWFED